MELNPYDVANCYIACIVTILVCFKYNYSNKILLVLLAHIVLIFVLDAFIPYSYMPDQFGYFASAYGDRHFNFGLASIFTPAGTLATGTTKFGAALLLAFLPFPVFIESVKSIAYINYYIYLLMFIFILQHIENITIKKIVKYFYCCYPTLILYTSSGTRDILIIAVMFFFLYYFMLYFSLWRILLTFLILLLIKPQNAGLMLVLLCYYYVRKIDNPLYAKVVGVLYILGLTGSVIYFWPTLMKDRWAMFAEDTGLPMSYLPEWTPLELYRVYFAPFFFDARNGFQIVQSVENLGLVIVVYKIFRYVKRMGIDKIKFHVMNFFAVVSSFLYSFVVFNYGTLTRYKFPFVFCWVLMTFMILDKTLSAKKEQDLSSEV